MCLVEIEGIPKLQTACSTPVKDGMVVHTPTARVQAAQQAVVEFLLINHPLDCPVCDKGGECPLQDISFGWGGGRSRFIEPKRHFEKPLALSPLVAIDRERCILCYRCVRFSQEISEDYQLVLEERGAHTYVGTFDGHPYVAPFSGNIIELCPVGALTSQPYRFRARPWDIEQAGSVCTLCPAQCNVSFTVRDDRVLRVLGRDNAEVDDGWLCDKGRFAYQAVHVDERITQPLLRDGGLLRPVTWERALDEAAVALDRARGRVGALAGDGATNEEGFLLQRLVREGLASTDLDSRNVGAPPDATSTARSRAPAVQATVSDLEFAHAVLVLDTEPVDDAPILDLRLRKGVRRHGVKLAVATSRPSSLDPNAKAVLRFAPGAGEALLGALDAVAGGRRPARSTTSPRAAGVTTATRSARWPSSCARAGEDVVVLAGERLVSGPRGEHAARALLNVLGRLGLNAGRAGAGPPARPAGHERARPGRGRRAPGAGPGFADAPAGRDAAGIAAGLAEGDLTALYLLRVDPVRDLPGRDAWDAALERRDDGRRARELPHRGPGRARHRRVPGRGLRREGRHGRPPGRPPAAPARGDRPPRPGARRVAGPRRPERPRWATTSASAAAPWRRAQLVEAVPFYAGLTLEEIGPKGVRWDAREAAAAFPRRRARAVRARGPARAGAAPPGACAWARSARSGPRARSRPRPR